MVHAVDLDRCALQSGSLPLETWRHVLPGKHQFLNFEPLKSRRATAARRNTGTSRDVCVAC
jgi:hypothetical protein